MVIVGVGGDRAAALTPGGWGAAPLPSGTMMVLDPQCIPSVKTAAGGGFCFTA